MTVVGKRSTGHALQRGPKPHRRSGVVPVLLLSLLLFMFLPAVAAQVGVPVESPEAPAAPSAPTVPSATGGVSPLDGVDPSVPEVPGGSGEAPRIETPPVAKDDSIAHQVPGGFPLLLVLVVAVGVVSTYGPGGIRRMRIESAWRVSNQGRLALAMGQFATALAAFDQAIEEAHAAYTRRNGAGRGVDWTLLPDAFYIELWRGRAAALRGMGRERAARFTEALASELEGALSAPA